jgi:endoglucanase
MAWGNAARYEGLFFTFRQDIDWAYLKDKGYCISLYAKTAAPVQFDIRFKDTEGTTELPWRLSFTVTQDTLPPDGMWHKITIPLRNMKEQGAYHNAKQQWTDPSGAFSWDRIASLEIVAETEDMGGKIVYIDNFKIELP